MLVAGLLWGCRGSLGEGSAGRRVSVVERRAFDMVNDQEIDLGCRRYQPEAKLRFYCLEEALPLIQGRNRLTPSVG